MTTSGPAIVWQMAKRADEDATTRVTIALFGTVVAVKYTTDYDEIDITWLVSDYRQPIDAQRYVNELTSRLEQEGHQLAVPPFRVDDITRETIGRRILEVAGEALFSWNLMAPDEFE